MASASLNSKLKLKCNFIINWKTTNSNSFLSNKDKTPAKYQSSVVYKFTCPGCKKTDRCFYTRIREHSLDNKSEVFNHITSCEHFQHIKSILELYPDEETNPTQTCILSELIFTNSKIIDRSGHWSLLLFKEALAIRRLKPELNHGTKASKELVIFS
jgi:DNA-directed RNA polymerase subunit M/transcription elongation factor TFIIS